MDTLWQSAVQVWRHSAGHVAIKLVAVLVGAVLAYRLLARLVRATRLHPQHQLVIRRLLGVVCTLVALILVLNTLGVGIGVLLGTAGVVTVVIGFAAQTSASNLISGFFLMAEQPFRVGDVIRVGEVTGEVVSVELLSVRLRTFDNLLVRLANEDVLKSPVTNLTHFPIRRIDVHVGVAYGSDLAEVRAALAAAAAARPIFLVDPAPLVMTLAFGDSAIELQLSVWSTTANFLEARNQLYQEIVAAFAAENIEIPFPQRTLSAKEPLPVHIE